MEKGVFTEPGKFGFKKGNPGRAKGSKNKTHKTVQDMLQTTVDWNERMDNLVKLANGGNMKAEELLWHYAWGKPVETTNVQSTEGQALKHEHVHSVDSGLMALANKFSKR